MMNYRRIDATLAAAVDESKNAKEPLLAAFAILMAIPLIVVFFLFQRYFVQGLNLSASKE